MEVEESTAKGFRYALQEAKADVLELDVQLTADGEFVVWHGPDLDIVRIENQPDQPTRRSRRFIDQYRWRELERAWVGGPGIKLVPLENRDLSVVPVCEDTRLLSLSEFLAAFPSAPLNIEMKETFRARVENIEAFTRILEDDPGERTMVVASGSFPCIKTFHALNGNRYPTALSIREQLLLRVQDTEMGNRCLETSHHWYVSGKGIVRKVRRLGGSTFVFLTAFGRFFPAMDEREEDLTERRVFRVLDRGVDGIMTDRPMRLRGIIDRWKQQASGRGCKTKTGHSETPSSSPTAT